MSPVLAGVAVGTALSIAVTRFLGSMLFEVVPTDPIAFVGAGGLLAAAALLGCGVPALRATRVDPLATLRAGTGE